MRIARTVAGLAGSLVVMSQMAAVPFEPGKGDGGVTGTRLVGGAERGSLPLVSVDIGVSRVGLTSSANDPADDFAYYGTSGGIRAFSMASTACNLSSVEAQWFSGPAGNHPVISQNMYRYLNGRFEQIGQSWLKHGSCAVSEPSCGACIPNATCNFLAEHCADTYWATLNDGASGGPKSRINPLGLGSGGTHNNHNWAAASGPAAIRGRLQIHDTDINAGGQNFAEVHYITHDEPLTNRYNNASWREVSLSLTSISGVFPDQASVHDLEPAIMAWQDVDPGVVIVTFEDTAQGRFHLGYRVTDNGDGTWHYEYALHNMNSDWGANSVSVPIPAGVTVTNVGFHDVDSHSGEPYALTDWAPAIGGGEVKWATQPEAENANVNALRWGTLYNFRFDADAPPQSANIVIGHFKTGAPPSMTVAAEGPSPVPIICPTDVNGDGATDVLDLIDLLLCFGLPAVPGCEAQDINNDSSVDVLDLIELLLEFGVACP